MSGEEVTGVGHACAMCKCSIDGISEMNYYGGGSNDKIFKMAISALAKLQSYSLYQEQGFQTYTGFSSTQYKNNRV